MSAGFDPNATKIDQRMSRAMNRRLVLNHIRRNPGLSRIAIANKVGLSPAVVGFVVGDLLTEGYIREDEPLVRGNGRRPVPLVINDDGHHAVGLKLSSGRLDCMIANLAVQEVARTTIALDSTDPQSVVAFAKDAVAQMLSDLGDKRRPIVGVGFSIPARLEIESGVCVSSLRFNWRDVPIAAMLSEALGYPVMIEDDTLAFGLAHHLFGLGRHHRNFLALAVGEGIGCASITDNGLRHGALGNAGKMGHMLYEGPLRSGDDPLCECGRQGCLQTFFSVTALATRWTRSGQAGTLQEALSDHHPEAVALVTDAGRTIGGYLAQAVTMIDPERIVLGGESVAFGEVFLAAMQDELNRCYYRQSGPAIVADQSSFYWTAGAAAVALQRIFDFEKSDG